MLRPTNVLASTAGMVRWGPSVAALYAAAALQRPHDLAVIDDWGACTFSDLAKASDQLAQGLAAEGLNKNDRIGLLCRNSRGFVIAAVAVAKLGADTVYLNTAAAGPQLAGVVATEQVSYIIHDEEFDIGAVAGTPVVATRSNRSWFPTAASDAADARLGPTLRPKLPVLMTSGTTGAPQGARRNVPRPNLAASTALLQRVPYRSGGTIATSSPLFHAWGAAQLMLGATLGATLVLRSRFDAAQCLDDIDSHKVDVLATVPVFVQQLLDHPSGGATLRRLQATVCSGSALPAPVGQRWLDNVGPSIYNVYGSTEVGQATIATPANLAAHPGTVGPPAPGCQVVVLDAERAPVPSETSGSIFVGSGMGFEAYSDGSTKERVGSLLATGDTGYFTADGCLMVTGRDDDMIITGGENVFPQEIEDCIRGDAGVSDVAIVGIPDPVYGQRVVAFIVPSQSAPAEATLRKRIDQLVRDQLASYKVPRTVLFQTTLPRNPAGKVLKVSLAAKAQDLLPSAD